MSTTVGIGCSTILAICSTVGVRRLTNTPSSNSIATAKSKVFAISMAFLKSSFGIRCFLITVPSRKTQSAPFNAIIPSYGTSAISWRSPAALPVAMTIRIPPSWIFLRASTEDGNTLWVSKLTNVPSTSSMIAFIITLISLFILRQFREANRLSLTDKSEQSIKQWQSYWKNSHNKYKPPTHKIKKAKGNEILLPYTYWYQLKIDSKRLAEVL